jgi:Flp pilus assembly pilin Flp
VNKISAAGGRVRECCSALLRGGGAFLAQRDKGATLVEYALLIGLIALACLAALSVLGTHISAVLTSVKNSLTSNGL